MYIQYKLILLAIFYYIALYTGSAHSAPVIGQTWHVYQLRSPISTESKLATILVIFPPTILLPTSIF